MEYSIRGENPHTVAEVIAEPIISGIGVARAWFCRDQPGKARNNTDYTEKK